MIMTGRQLVQQQAPVWRLVVEWLGRMAPADSVAMVAAEVHSAEVRVAVRSGREVAKD